MFPSSSLGGFPMTSTSNDYYKFSNFEIYYGPGSKVSVPLLKESQTTVIIKNLPRKVTKEMIEELLISKPLLIQSSAVKSIDLLGVVNGKDSCKIEFDLDVNASLVNSIHTWYMRINNIRDESHESNMIVEYPELVHPECNAASIQQLKEDLKDDSSFKDAFRTLEHWLKQGEVNKQNAGDFNSLLYLVYTKGNALNDEIMASDTKLDDNEKELKSEVEELSLSLKELKKVLHNASKQKVWDHFTKAQRKNLHAWKEEVKKLDEEYSRELLGEREEAEMEVCGGGVKESMEVPDESTISALKDKLAALLNEKASLEEEFIEMKKEKDEEMARKQAECHEVLSGIAEWQEKLDAIKKDLANMNDSTANSETAAEPQLSISSRDVYQLGLLTSFLKLHLNGANIEYLSSYFNDSDLPVTPEDLEEFMRRFPNMFIEETTGIGATLRKVWKYQGPRPPAE